jgi:hypothetical protein
MCRLRPRGYVPDLDRPKTTAPAEAPYFCKNHDLFERLKHEIESEAALQTA